MPKNKVTDLISDQEIAFARLVLSGAMTDRQAAEAAGMNPDSAAYTKAKPRVSAYMREHRAAVQQQLAQQEAEGLHRLNLDRDQVLARLWQIANLSPEMTRGSITSQVKALSMIVAMQNFIPDRRAVPAEKNPPTATPQPKIYAAAWLAGQQATTTASQPGPATVRQQESAGVRERDLITASAEEALPDLSPGRTASATHFDPSQPQPPAPYAAMLTSVPDARATSSTNQNHFIRRR